jgi:mannose-1-phosphate guanylyltransferase
MRAVVLVGGFGTRLRPLTNTTPKPMLPVVNRPMIEHLVGGLARAGITQVTLALGFKPEPFVEAFPDGTCAGVRLDYAVEPEPLDTAGAIRFAADHAGIDETFVVANGDIMTDLDVSALVAAHRASGAEATIHVYPVDDPSAFGVVELDGDCRVLRFVEKPPLEEAPSNLINAGTYVLEPSVLRRVATGRRVSIERETFPAIVADGGLYAFPSDVYWLDTGRPELYLQANLDVLAGRRAHLAATDVIDPSAQIDSGARVEGSVVGRGCLVGPGAQVEDSVLLPGACIESDAVVRRSIIAGVVGRGASLLDVVVGADGTVPADEVLSDARVPQAG